MTPGQLLRHWAEKVRIASRSSRVDVAAGAQERPAGRPGRLAKAAQFASAFLVTLSAIAIGFALLSARLSQVRPDWSVAAAPVDGGPSSFAAADAALGVIAADDAYRDGFFIAPARRRARLAAFQVGAAAAVGAFAAALDERRRRSDPDLALAAGELSALALDGGLDMESLAAGRDALKRFADRAADRRVRFEPSGDGLIGIVLACQTAALAHATDLAAEGQHGRAWPISMEAEASFYRARGEAFAWRLLLSAYVRDLPVDQRARVEPALSRLVAAAEDAANFQPLFLISGAPGAAAAPNHLAILGRKLVQMSARAEQLQRDLRAPPPV